jgi:hypothetical protein
MRREIPVGSSKWACDSVRLPGGRVKGRAARQRISWMIRPGVNSAVMYAKDLR